MNPFFRLIEKMVENFVMIFLVVTWLFGIVIAKGFWSTMFAIFPLYAWYLVIEKYAIMYNLI